MHYLTVTLRHHLCLFTEMPSNPFSVSVWHLSIQLSTHPPIHPTLSNWKYCTFSDWIGVCHFQLCLLKSFRPIEQFSVFPSALLFPYFPSFFLSAAEPSVDITAACSDLSSLCYITCGGLSKCVMHKGSDTVKLFSCHKWADVKCLRLKIKRLLEILTN